MKKAIYAGTFDPMTFGHLDVVKRASVVVDELIVSIADNPGKDPLFSVQERVELSRQVVQDLANVTVESFSGLLVAYARSKSISVIVRGLRAFSDFEFEFQMALTNRKMAPDIETVFLMPKQDFSYISSNTVKQVARLGGEIEDFVPAPVKKALQQKFNQG